MVKVKEDKVIILLSFCVVFGYFFLFVYDYDYFFGYDVQVAHKMFIFSSVSIHIGTYIYMLNETIINTIEAYVIMYLGRKLESVIIRLNSFALDEISFSPHLLYSVCKTYFIFRLSDIFTFILIYDQYPKIYDVLFIFILLGFYIIKYKKHG